MTFVPHVVVYASSQSFVEANVGQPDTAKGDPTGTWSLRASDFNTLGDRIGALGRPLLVLQEGGYDNRTIGADGLDSRC